MSAPAAQRGLRSMAVRVAGTALLATLGVTANAGDTGGDPRDLLERMVRASRTLDYVGTFVYRSGSTLQSMKIVHRADAHGSRERLVALSGAAREVIRDGQRVICILPDDRAVVVTTRQSGSASRAAVFGSNLVIDRDLDALYTLSISGAERVANLEAIVIDVRPKDRYRYGFRFAVDRHSGLLLKSELLGNDRTTLEQIVYTHLELPDSIPDEALESELTNPGLIRYWTADAADTAAGPVTDAQAWSVGWLPSGFRMTSESYGRIHTVGNPVEHRVYSDGLVSISIFIERALDPHDGLVGPYSAGAVNAYSRMVDEYHISVVGEVPGITAAGVAASIAKR